MTEEVKITHEEFKGNISVSISDNEVRVWLCSDGGVCKFRFKAVGKVHKVINQGTRDIIVIGGSGE